MLNLQRQIQSKQNLVKTLHAYKKIKHDTVCKLDHDLFQIEGKRFSDRRIELVKSWESGGLRMEFVRIANPGLCE